MTSTDWVALVVLAVVILILAVKADSIRKMLGE